MPPRNWREGCGRVQQMRGRLPAKWRKECQFDRGTSVQDSLVHRDNTKEKFLSGIPPHTMKIMDTV
jgi:hypothetical protein